jgi:hypothetical protein
MQKLLIASIFVLAAAGTSIAGPEGFPNPYFVAMHTESGTCVIMNKEPNAKYFKSMGKYGSMEEAHKAMGSMKECA